MLTLAIFICLASQNCRWEFQGTEVILELCTPILDPWPASRKADDAIVRLRLIAVEYVVTLKSNQRGFDRGYSII